MAYKKFPRRLASFKAYCEKENFKLLLEDYYYIDDLLDNFDKSDFKAILGDYLKKWHEGIGNNEKASQKQNLSRYNANSWLREHANGPAKR